VTREIDSIKVVHVAPTPFGDDGLYGGGERYPLELARALAGALAGSGACELVTFGHHPRLIHDPGGLRIRVLRAATHLGGHPAHPVSLGLPAALRSADVVHTHHLWSTPGQVAAVAGRALRRRVVSTDHGLPPAGLGRLVPRLVDRVLAVSRYSAEVLGTPPGKTSVIYGGADPVRFHPDRQDRRDGILFVGRFTPHKGLDRLLRALPDGARLTCVGTPGHDPRPPESGYPELLRRLAAERDVVFAEHVSDAELPLLLRRSRVLVLPSVHQTCYGRRVPVSELLGLAVLEAMASATPVICSRLGGLPEVVDDGETGYLVPPGDVAILHQRLAAVLADPVGAERLGRNARQAVLERFTWAACAQRCLAAYEELLANGPA
jgi:glycosyltransferase involved in cell wall biosynthesis